jgi:chemotaxis protein CheY-P-specific phosphatase CheC
MNTPDTTNQGTRPLDAARLTGLVTTALERMAFVMAEPIEADAADIGSLRFATRVTFTGAAAGECLIAASEGFTRELIAGFLGVDAGEADPAQQGQDALNELANIIAGMVIRELGNQTNRIYLGLPARAEALAVGPALRSADTLTCGLDSCGEQLMVVVRVQKVIAKAA